MLISKSTLAHLRFVFSVFLLPVYLFAYSQTNSTLSWFSWFGMF